MKRPSSGNTRIRASREERYEAGKRLRKRLPRTSHARWSEDSDRPNPLKTLHRDDKGRQVELVPIRYGRMVRSSFAFYRGAASVMARDLSKTPTTGLWTQICGDAHLSNFGGFATPERNLIFDISDFDETNPGPWEWDVKRLVASTVIAARYIGLKKGEVADVALACAQSYRKHMRRYAKMKTLQVWYERLDEKAVLDSLESASLRKRIATNVEKAKRNTSERVYPKLTGGAGVARFVDQPPLIFHRPHPNLADGRKILERYRMTLQDDRRELLDRYMLADIAYKVVGVGSVGTYCGIALLLAASDDPLILQLKQARRSVLEPYTGKSDYETSGERVVTGQRLMQGASDLFLGWFKSNAGLDMYARQLRDMKLSPDVETMTAEVFERYVELCGWTLARAHAKGGDIAPEIAGYLGGADDFDQSMLSFAKAYADQNERDFKMLVEAVRSGRLPVENA